MGKQIPLQSSVYEHLKREIIEGNFSADRFYSLGAIAEELGMSKTPVRDALQRLGQEGFVEILPGRGIRVCPLTDRDLIVIYQTRCSVESYCCRYLAENHQSDATKKALRLMEENLQRQEEMLEKSTDSAVFFPVDRQLHDIFVDALGNEYFSTMNQNCNERIKQFANQSQRKDVLRITLEEHREIYESIRAGDTVKSELALFCHLGSALSFTLGRRTRSALRPAGAGPAFGGSFLQIDRKKTMKDYENEIIAAVLKEENQNLSRTARRLGIGRSTLWKKLGKQPSASK